MKPPVRKTKKVPSARAPAKTQGLLVLGMHRSGTSAVTRVLNLLGCALADNLVGPSDGNETGHWESLAALELNDAILASAGSHWADWGAINDDWHQSGLKAEMIGRIRQVIENHAALGPLFALKDPRMCRVADLWLTAMADAQVEPRVLLMLRNPAEVCASLEERDLTAPGYSQLLWLRHVLDAEHFSRGVRRVVCRYDQLMRNWPGVVDRVKTGLGIALPRNTPAVHAEIEKFLKAEYRHHERSADAVLGDLGQSAWLRRTFAIMLAWSEQGENKADHADLDRIRHELDQAYATFARLLLRMDAVGEAGAGRQLQRELNEQLTTARQAEEAASEAVQEAESRRATAAEREAELQARMEAGQAETAQLQAELNMLRDEAVQAAHVAAEADALRAREAELVVRLDDTSAQAQQLQAEIDALRAEADRTALIAAEADALRAREQQLAQDVAQLEAALEAARTTVEQERQQRLAADRTLATHIDKLHDQQVRNAELAGRATAAESALVQRQEELSQLWSQLLVAEKAAAVAESQVAQEREQRQDGERRLAAAEANATELQSRLERVQAAPAQVPDNLIAEIAQLTGLLKEQEAMRLIATAAQAEAEGRLARQEAETRQLQAKLHEQDAAARAAEASHALSEQNVAARFDEIARLTSILADAGARSDTSAANTEWLRNMMQMAASFPAWWSMMPQAWRRKREHARYRNSGLFDARRYLETYPDVAEHGMDPVRHYILHGILEGRIRPT